MELTHSAIEQGVSISGARSVPKEPALLDEAQHPDTEEAATTSSAEPPGEQALLEDAQYCYTEVATRTDAESALGEQALLGPGQHCREEGGATSTRAFRPVLLATEEMEAAIASHLLEESISREEQCLRVALSAHRTAARRLRSASQLNAWLKNQVRKLTESYTLPEGEA